MSISNFPFSEADKNQEAFVKGWSGTFRGDVSVVITNADKKWEAIESLRKKIIDSTLAFKMVSVAEGQRMNEWATGLAMKLLGFE